MSQLLFDGNIENGKLSNQKEIIANVPEEFVQGNEWYDYVQELFMNGSPVWNRDWIQKAPGYHEVMWDHMYNCFRAMYNAQGATPTDWIPACACMLSFMLEEVPPLRGSVPNCS